MIRRLLILAWCFTAGSALAAALSFQCLYALQQAQYYPESYEGSAARKELAARYRNDPAFAAWFVAQPELPLGAHQILARYDALTPAQRAAPALAPTTVDLTGYGKRVDLPPGFRGRIEGLKRAFRRWFGRGEYENQTVDPDMNRYRNAVAALREGDTVVFGRRRFKLGKYLGAGNATHIYALADQPGRAIRIPFLVQKLEGTYTDPVHPIHWHLRFLQDRPTNGVNAVRIHESGEGYAIVDRVNGSETGDAFARTVGIRYLNAFGFDEAARRLTAANDREGLEKLTKLRAQLELYAAQAPMTAGPNPRPRRLTDVSQVSRQFVWDVDKKDWFMVDFE